MQIFIKRVNSSLPMPQFHSDKAAGFDLMARKTMNIKAHSVSYVPLNVIVKMPDNCWALLAARSSLHKKGLIMANGIGVGDADYCGESDEYMAILYNYTDSDVTIEQGDRIAQMIILPRSEITLKEVKSVSKVSRGGIGSTGK